MLFRFFLKTKQVLLNIPLFWVGLKEANKSRKWTWISLLANKPSPAPGMSLSPTFNKSSLILQSKMVGQYILSPIFSKYYHSFFDFVILRMSGSPQQILIHMDLQGGVRNKIALESLGPETYCNIILYSVKTKSRREMNKKINIIIRWRSNQFPVALWAEENI